MSKRLLRLGRNCFSDTAFYRKESNWKDGVLYAGCCLVDAKSAITECKITEGTRVIADVAFGSSLASVSIPDSVVNIGYEAFHYTALYKNAAKWEDNVLYIDHCLIDVKQEVFMGEQEVKKGTRVIAEAAFARSFALTGITLPDSLVTIGAYAFRSCTALPSVEVPYGVSYVGTYAFDGCAILTSVSLPSSLEYMGINVFKGCQSLASIKVFATKPPMVNETLGVNKSIPVYVPEESIEAYKAADGWCEFTNFQPLKDKEKKKTTSVKEEKVEVTTKPTASETPKAEPKAEKTAAPIVEKVETVVDTVAPEALKAEPKHEKPTAPAAEEPKTAAASATSPAKPNLSDVKKSAETKDYLVTQGNDGSITVYHKNGNEWEESDNAKGALREIAAKASFNYDESWNTRQFGAKLIDALSNNKSATAPVSSKIKVYARAQNRMALGIIHAYFTLHPQSTLEELEEVFPKSLNPDSGVKKNLTDIETIEKVQGENWNGFFMDEECLLHLQDGRKVAVVSMWTKPSLQRLLDHCQQFGIEIEKLESSDTLNKKMGFRLEY